MVEKRRQVRVQVIKDDAGVRERKVIVKRFGGDDDEDIDVSEFLDEEDLPDGTRVITVKIPSRERGEARTLAPAAATSEAIGGLQEKLGELVRQARADGYTWTQIGQALGMSKQAAWERFSGEE